MARWLTETAHTERLDALKPASIRELLQRLVEPGGLLQGSVNEIAWSARRSGVSWTAIADAIGVPRIRAMTYFGAAGRAAPESLTNEAELGRVLPPS